MPLVVERTLFRVGEDSFAVTLPKEWIRRQSLRHGDRVEVTVDGDIIIRPAPHGRQEGQQHRNTAGQYHLRFLVLRRDNFRCQYCGRAPKEDGVKLVVDHIIPVSEGGTNEEGNLLTSCTECKRGKDNPLLDNVYT